MERYYEIREWAKDHAQKFVEDSGMVTLVLGMMSWNAADRLSIEQMLSRLSSPYADMVKTKPIHSKNLYALEETVWKSVLVKGYWYKYMQKHANN